MSSLECVFVECGVAARGPAWTMGALVASYKSMQGNSSAQSRSCNLQLPEHFCFHPSDNRGEPLPILTAGDEES